MRTITDEKLLHCRGVAERMRLAVLEHPGLFSLTGEQAYVVGLLHDVGYAFCELDATWQHETRGALVLREMGFSQWNLVATHGSHAGCPGHSDEGVLLLWADMHVLPGGVWCTFSERIAELAGRAGAERTAEIARQSRDTWLCHPISRALGDEGASARARYLARPAVSHAKVFLDYAASSG